MSLSMSNKGEKKIRQSNFELLRIVGMLMIILHHLCYHGGIYGAATGGAKWVANLLYLGGGLGIQIFMLISSYFLMESRFSSKRLLRVVFEIWFYSVVIALIFKLGKIGNLPFTWKTWVTCLMPVTYNSAWFATTYVLIYLLSPFINKMLHQLSKRQYQALLLVSLVFFNLIPSFSWVQPTRVFFNAITLFLEAYFWAGYLRRFSIVFLERKGIAAAVFIGCIAILWGGQHLFAVLGQKHEFFKPLLQPLINYESVFFLAAALAIFMLFQRMQMGSNRLINLAASGAFGVYLIHDNAMVRSVLWNKIVKTQSMLQLPWQMILVYAVGYAAGIYVCLAAIDLLRQYFVEKPLFRIKRFDRAFEKADQWMNGTD